MTLIDLTPAAERMAEIVEGVPEGRLYGPTPCADYSVGDLLHHVAGLAVAFAHAATKTEPPGGSQPPSGDASRLADDWRAHIPADLVLLAAAWEEASAWEGMTRVGGTDLPGEMAGVIGLDELVIHAWDLARATGQPFDVDPASLQVVHGFVSGLNQPAQQALRSNIFGPVVDVDAHAALLDRTLGLAGRQPSWSPS